MSVLGLTIDYGPYGWVDNFDPDWTPNTTDAESRRYGYGRQADIAQWNLWQLANAILVVTKDAAALEKSLKDFSDYYGTQRREMLAAKLGLRNFEAEAGDEILLGDLNELLQAQEIDMTLFYRALADFNPAGSGPQLPQLIEPALYHPERVDTETVSRLNDWGERYSERLRADRVQNEARKAQMNAVNPLYVLRNYLAQESIDKAYEGDYGLLHELYEVLRSPYTEQPGFSRYAGKRPEWARNRPGSSSLSCSS